MGYGLTDKAPEKIPEIETAPLVNAPHTQDELIAAKTIGQLRSEAAALGIEVKNTMNKESLAAAILNF